MDQAELSFQIKQKRQELADLLAQEENIHKSEDDAIDAYWKTFDEIIRHIVLLDIDDEDLSPNHYEFVGYGGDTREVNELIEELTPILNNCVPTRDIGYFDLDERNGDDYCDLYLKVKINDDKLDEFNCLVEIEFKRQAEITAKMFNY